MPNSLEGAFWRVLLQVDRVFKAVSDRFHRQIQPRTFLLGKLEGPCGHALFRADAPRSLYPRQDARRSPTEVMREAYSHEVSQRRILAGRQRRLTFMHRSFPTPIPTPAGFSE